MSLNPQPSDEVLEHIYSTNYFFGKQTFEGKKFVQEMKWGMAELYLGELLTMCRESGGKLVEVEYTI